MIAPNQMPIAADAGAHRPGRYIQFFVSTSVRCRIRAQTRIPDGETLNDLGSRAGFSWNLLRGLILRFKSNQLEAREFYGFQ